MCTWIPRLGPCSLHRTKDWKVEKLIHRQVKLSPLVHRQGAACGRDGRGCRRSQPPWGDGGIRCPLRGQCPRRQITSRPTPLAHRQNADDLENKPQQGLEQIFISCGTMAHIAQRHKAVKAPATPRLRRP